jgi:lantibiotic leader peptide-processing serine protease
MKKVLLFVLLCSLLMVGASVNAGNNRSYYIIANGNFPSNLSNQISRAGGTITNNMSGVGLIVVSSNNPLFASSIQGVRAVVAADAVRVYADPVVRVAAEGDVNAEAVNPPNNDGSYDTRYPLLWGLDAVNAPEAWEDGSTGAGVRVAVLDGGFNINHPDLVPNIVQTADMTGEGIAYGPNSDDPTGIFSHGTHVAGTIAAARNGIGVIGVAPEADLILVKVLFNYGSGSFEDVIEGIIYAADADADVINMSLGADIPQGSGVGSNEVAALRAVMQSALNYAYQSGAIIMVAAGNDGRDLDHDQSTTVFPAGLNHATAISATAPIGWAVSPANANLDFLASYSNFGRSGIDFAAPGGDASYPGNENCLIGGLVRPCWVFDLVFSDGGFANGGHNLYWSAGTSMATPHASGIAALIIGENGGDMNPAQVKAEMAARADDLGQPGNDPIYGAGRLSSGH